MTEAEAKIEALIAENKSLRDERDAAVDRVKLRNDEIDMANRIAKMERDCAKANLERAEKAEAQLATLTRPPSDEEVGTIVSDLSGIADAHAVGEYPQTVMTCHLAADLLTRLAQANKTAIEEAFAKGAREGWMRALVNYVDVSAEGNPEFIAAMDRRWTVALSTQETKPGARGHGPAW